MNRLSSRLWHTKTRSPDKPLGNERARVALLEARMSGELADLVERFGGTLYSVPAGREVAVPHLEVMSVRFKSVISCRMGLRVPTILDRTVNRVLKLNLCAD